jgi:hypothetical protein
MGEIPNNPWIGAFSHHHFVAVFFMLVAMITLLYPCTARDIIIVPVGSTVPLSGNAPGQDSVYLFLTGPNLPDDGVRLNDIRLKVVNGDSSSFTQARVEQGRWRYKWETRTAGGVPDAGTYTIWVTDRPVGRSNLQNAAYSEITVILITYAVSSGTGVIQIQTIPGGATVSLDGQVVGSTPFRKEDLVSKDYNLTVEKEGYVPVNRNIILKESETIEIILTLESAVTETILPEGTISTITSPVAPPPSPTQASFMVILVAWALIVVILARKD